MSLSHVFYHHLYACMQEALTLLTAAITSCPTYAEAYNNLGVLQRDVGAIPEVCGWRLLLSRGGLLSYRFPCCWQSPAFTEPPGISRVFQRFSSHWLHRRMFAPPAKRV